MNTSPEIGELAKALAAAQGEMKNPEFDSQNTFFKKPDGTASKYASLAAVRNAVVPALAKHSIALTQELTSTTNPPAVGCTTRMTHSSGQWMDLGPFWIPVGKADAQGFVAAGTYAKRGSMQAVLCLVGDDDDDGEEAVGRGARKPTKKEPPAGVSDDDFPPKDGPIGKAPAKPAEAPKPAEPAAAPPVTRASLEALPLVDLCKLHAAKLGRASTNEEIGAMNGDLANKNRFGLDDAGVLALRNQLIGMLMGGGK